MFAVLAFVSQSNPAQQCFFGFYRIVIRTSLDYSNFSFASISFSIILSIDFFLQSFYTVFRKCSFRFAFLSTLFPNNRFLTLKFQSIFEEAFL